AVLLHTGGLPDRGRIRLLDPGILSMKIGLIAMSGVRACDPELMRLGMTLPGFVERGKVVASLPSLGLLTLAGMTPPSHTCEYYEDFRPEQMSPEELRRGFIDLGKRLYSHELTERRRAKFEELYRGSA